MPLDRTNVASPACNVFQEVLNARLVLNVLFLGIFVVFL
jgi:hypothetical protein